MSDYNPILDVSGITIDAGSARLVDSASLSLEAGEIVGLLGANGAGKSTLLKACAGDLRTAAGAIRIDGRDIREFTPSQMAARRAIVSQASELSFPFTAREVVLLGATVPGFRHQRPHLNAAAEAALGDVGLLHLSERLYPHLSGGERQRVQIARALCQLATAPRADGDRASETPYRTRRAPLLLLDEPTSSLDLAHQRLILARMRRLADGGGAVLAVLHDVNLAAAYCDRIVVMKSGRILAQGVPRDVIVSKVLSEAYGCPIEANAVPAGAIPFALPVTGTGGRQAMKT